MGRLLAGSLRVHLQRVFLFSFVFVAAASFAGVWALAVRARDRDEAAYFTGLAQVLAELVRHPLEISDYSDAQRMLSFISHEAGIIPAVLTDEGDVLLGDYGQRAESGLDKLKSRANLSCAQAARLLGAEHRKLFCSEIFGIRGGISTSSERLGLSLVVVGARPHLFPFRELFVIFSVMLASLMALSWAIRIYFTRSIVVPLESLRAWVAARKVDPLAPSRAAKDVFAVGELDDLRAAFEDLYEAVRVESNRRQETERDLALQDLASQVAHDIRSPLAALDVAAGDVSQLPEDKRILMRAAVGRIRDIANSLLGRQRVRAAAAPEAASPFLLSSLVDPVVSEKRPQFRARAEVRIDLKLDAPSYGLFASVQSVEFKRLLSNLINNAVEALGSGSGSVAVGLAARGGLAVVSVRDDGKGIPPDVLSRLGRRGETHDKDGGSGLGLHHARTAAESWGGKLEITSEVGKGSLVELSLPSAPEPDWFVSELRLRPGLAVVILDDDATIHQVWQSLLDALGARARGIETVQLYTPGELRDWVKERGARALDALYLLDFELVGFAETGLSLAGELGIADSSVLVTSRYDEPGVLKECRELGVRLVPKGLAALVPIRIVDRELWDAVLIDDDPLARVTWRMVAERAGKRVRIFATAAEFHSAADTIDLETPVYVDAELADGVKGDAESKRIHDRGFANVYLATGHPPETYVGLAHLRGAVGKEPPWGDA